MFPSQARSGRSELVRHWMQIAGEACSRSNSFSRVRTKLIISLYFSSLKRKERKRWTRHEEKKGLLRRYWAALVFAGPTTTKKVRSFGAVRRKARNQIIIGSTDRRLGPKKAPTPPRAMQMSCVRQTRPPAAVAFIDVEKKRLQHTTNKKQQTIWKKSAILVHPMYASEFVSKYSYYIIAVY